MRNELPPEVDAIDRLVEEMRPAAPAWARAEYALEYVVALAIRAGASPIQVIGLRALVTALREQFRKLG